VFKTEQPDVLGGLNIGRMFDVAKLLTAVQRYSARAEEARTRADQMENLAAREAMLDVAASYEHLEGIARVHLQSLFRRSAAEPPPPDRFLRSPPSDRFLRLRQKSQFGIEKSLS
jgi:hypothetical protein